MSDKEKIFLNNVESKRKQLKEWKQSQIIRFGYKGMDPLLVLIQLENMGLLWY